MQVGLLSRATPKGPGRGAVDRLFSFAVCCVQLIASEARVLSGLRRLGYPFLDQLPSIEHILTPGKLRYQLLEWLFLQYRPLLLPTPTESLGPNSILLASPATQVRREPARAAYNHHQVEHRPIRAEPTRQYLPSLLWTAGVEF
jgi:hypothetical protein